MTGLFLSSLSLATAAQGQQRKIQITKSSAPECVIGNLSDKVIFCPKLTPPNVHGGSCTLPLTTSTACYEFLPCVNMNMSATALTNVYLSPENRSKAALSEPGLEEFLSRRNENFKLEFATVTTI